MDRRHIQEEKIVDYVLGQLPSKEHFKVNAHLAVCPTCRSEKGDWEKYLNIETIPSPSPHLKQKIFTKIDLKQHKVQKRWVYITLSLCFVFLISFSFLKSPKPLVHNDYSDNLVVQFQDLFAFKSPNAIDRNPLNILPTHIVNDEIWMNVKDFEQLYMNSLTTGSFDEQSRITFLDHSQNHQINFLIEEFICSYDLYNNQISCIQMKNNPQFNQSLQNDFKIYFLNQ